MSKTENTNSGGISFLGLLQVALVVLKLCDVINWSWWWVCAPTWMSMALVLLVILFTLIIAGCQR